ncbi:MAG: DUF1844 domain-containing protein [Candidatus Woesearchaeota archaeon]
MENTDNNIKDMNVPDNIFVRHVISLHTGALIFLGKIKNPITGEEQKNIKEAKEIIDLLKELKKKTENNLSEYENKIFDNAITQLQYEYVKETILDKNGNNKED